MLHVGRNVLALTVTIYILKLEIVLSFLNDLAICFICTLQECVHYFSTLPRKFKGDNEPFIDLPPFPGLSMVHEFSLFDQPQQKTNIPPVVPKHNLQLLKNGHQL